MDCADATILLHDLGRGRLEPAVRDEVRRHLEGCEACRRREAAEVALDAVLAEHAPRHVAPPALRARLERLAAGAGGRPEREPPARSRPPVALALAVGLGAVALAATLALELRANRVEGDARALALLTGEAVGDHLRLLLAERPVEVPSSDRHQVKPWFEGRLDFAPAVPQGEGTPLELRGGAVGVFLDRKAAVLAYRLRLHQVTLLAFRADGLTWPDGGAELGPVPAHRASVRGFQVVLWRAGPLGYALISDVDAAELDRMAAGLAAATVR